MTRLQMSEKQAIRENLDALPGPVRLVLITDADASEACHNLREICRDLEMISSRFILDVHDHKSNDTRVRRYNVPLVPALIVEGVAGARVRFFGTPSGFEFASFLESLRDAAEGKFNLHATTRHKFSNLVQPVRIDVMVPSTCVFCPPAVKEAEKLAFTFPQVVANIIKLADFPALARHYHGDYSTHVVVNGHEIMWEGVSEAAFADRVLEAVHELPPLLRVLHDGRAVA